MNKITIKAKEYPSRTTLGAMVRFKEMTGYDVSQIKDDISDVAKFMYCCARSACACDGVEFEMSFLDFADSISVDELNQFQQDNSKKKSQTAVK